MASYTEVVYAFYSPPQNIVEPELYYTLACPTTFYYTIALVDQSGTVVRQFGHTYDGLHQPSGRLMAKCKDNDTVPVYELVGTFTATFTLYADATQATPFFTYHYAPFTVTGSENAPAQGPAPVLNPPPGCLSY
jgi:hypothetical protein